MTFDYKIPGERGISEADISQISDQLLESLFERRTPDTVCPFPDKIRAVLKRLTLIFPLEALNRIHWPWVGRDHHQTSKCGAFNIPSSLELQNWQTTQ
jgi:hypothetical protein